MSKELAQLPNDVVTSIVLNNNLSGLTKEQQVQYVSYRCHKAGLDVAGHPFDLITNKDGKTVIYANKEAAAQLNQLRSLSPVVSKEEFLMGETIYKVTYKVTENGRSTEDCGAVGLVKIKKGVQGQPDEARKMSPDEVADAIMKAHTKAKRRAILTHCGIGTNDADEPLIVVDTDQRKEEIKEAAATVKDVEKPIPSTPTQEVKQEDAKPEKPKPLKWKGIITQAEPLELPGGAPAWCLHGFDGKMFKTDDEKHVKDGIEASVEYEIVYHANGRGTLVIDKIKEAKS